VVFAVALVLVSVFLATRVAKADAACSMAGAQPDSGTMTLQYLRPSTQNADRNDYRLSGTIRWNNAGALACFDAGRIDWAYEHNLTYQKHFDRKIWSEDFSSFPSASSPYIDTTASDHGDLTDLTFGLFRPETLKAGVTYRYAYSLFLPNDPPAGYQSFLLEGQVLERNCSRAGPWCVGLDSLFGESNGKAFIGPKRQFAVKGTTCWAWQKGKDPTLCPSGGSGGSGGGGGGGSGGPGPTSPGSSLPPGQYYVQNAEGGIYWRSGPDWNTAEATPGNGFYPGTVISPTCYQAGAANVPGSADGMWEQATIVSGPGSGSGWINEHFVADGQPINQSSPGIPACGSTAPAPPPPAQTWSEQETPNHPVNTFTDYHNASGMGPAIASGQWIQVSCKVYDPTIASVNPDGYWYRVASPPWNGAYYSPANTFMNGDPYGGPYTHNTDFAVPDC
jgi:hypothetical protein